MESAVLKADVPIESLDGKRRRHYRHGVKGTPKDGRKTFFPEDNHGTANRNRTIDPYGREGPGDRS
jgi:hypothetical protein